MQQKSHRNPKQRGMALVTTMLILFAVIAVLMLGLVSSISTPGNSGVMSMTSGAITMANSRSNSTIAFNNAESGVEFAMQWFHDQSGPPTNTSSFALTSTNTTATWTLDDVSVPGHTKVVMPTGCVTIIVYPSPTNNVGGTTSKYMIESVGYSGTIGASGTMSTIIHAYISQTSFDYYSYFIDAEQSGNWLVGGLTQFDGPVHSNNDGGSGAPTVAGEDNILWFNQTGQQVFLWQGANAYSCSAPSVNWALNNIGTATAPASSSDFYDIAAYGQAGINYNTDYIPMPTSGSQATQQQVAALGTTTAPTTTGVIVPNSSSTTTAGIYITGNVTNMTLSVSNAVNQIITVKQTDSNGYALTSVITLNAQTNQTTLAVTSGKNQTTTTSTYNGLTNGVVYCTGSIGVTRGANPGQGLSGVIADNVVSGGVVTHNNNLTIATSKQASSGDQILLNGSITCNTPPKTNGVYDTNNAAFKLNAGVLGLESYDMWIQKYTASGAINSNVEVDAATIATGIFDADAYNDSSVIGNFYGVGSYISGMGGYFGEMTMSGQLVAGYNEHHLYDPRLGSTSNDEPPYFDTTGMTYNILSWQVVSSIIS